MKTVSLFNKTTGVLSGQTITRRAELLADAMLAFPDHDAIEGEFDAQAQKIDLATRQAVDYIPPQPSADHVWNATAKRWVYVSTLDELKGKALLRANMICAAQIAAITANVPQGEIDSWTKQEAEARAWTASNAAPTPLLAALASARGVTVAFLAPKIITKANAVAAASGAVIGRRQKLEAAIIAAPDKAALAALFDFLTPA